MKPIALAVSLPSVNMDNGRLPCKLIVLVFILNVTLKLGKKIIIQIYNQSAQVETIDRISVTDSYPILRNKQASFTLMYNVMVLKAPMFKSTQISRENTVNNESYLPSRNTGTPLKQSRKYMTE